MAVVVIFEPFVSVSRLIDFPAKTSESGRAASRLSGPFSDVVSLFVIELTTQFPTSEGSQITAAIDEKFCV